LYYAASMGVSGLIILPLEIYCMVIYLHHEEFLSVFLGLLEVYLSIMIQKLRISPIWELLQLGVIILTIRLPSILDMVSFHNIQME